MDDADLHQSGNAVGQIDEGVELVQRLLLLVLVHVKLGQNEVRQGEFGIQINGLFQIGLGLLILLLFDMDFCLEEPGQGGFGVLVNVLFHAFQGGRVTGFCRGPSSPVPPRRGDNRN